MERAINFGLSLVGAKYCWWYEGALGENAPAWNGSGPVDKRLIFENGLFCAGLINVMLREIGLQPPKNPPYDGGTEAYQLSYPLEPFDIKKVRRGDIVLRAYTDAEDQGHIALALGGEFDPLLQCFASHKDSTTPGVNINYTLKLSHSGYFYQYIIKREDLWKK